MEAAIGIEPMNKGFADLCLTTWLRRRTKGERRKLSRDFLLSPFAFLLDLWSGRRDLNSRLRPWQGRTLPLSYSRLRKIDSTDSQFLVKRALLGAQGLQKSSGASAQRLLRNFSSVQKFRKTSRRGRGGGAASPSSFAGDKMTLTTS